MKRWSPFFVLPAMGLAVSDAEASLRVLDRSSRFDWFTFTREQVTILTSYKALDRAAGELWQAASSTCEASAPAALAVR
jgi:hypothetical protein